MYDRILLPTDGSDAAETVVDHVVELARAHGSTVHVLSVVEPVPTTEADAAAVLETLRENAEETVERTAGTLADAGVNTETAVRTGAPGRSILDYAEEADVDLVVMGTHGRSGLGRVLLGSVAERVVRHADVPVLTVRYREETE